MKRSLQENRKDLDRSYQSSVCKELPSSEVLWGERKRGISEDFVEVTIFQGMCVFFKPDQVYSLVCLL